MAATFVHTIAVPCRSAQLPGWFCECSCGRSAHGGTEAIAAAAIVEHLGYVAWPIV